MKKFFKNKIVIGALITGFFSLISVFLMIIFQQPTENKSYAPQVVEDNSGSVVQIQGDVKINEQAKYVWVNEKTWKAKMQDNGSGRYQVNMVFSVDGPIAPVTPCLYISSNTEIISSGPVGYSLNLYKESTPNSLFECFGGLTSTVVFQTFFNDKPTEIKATLIESEKKFDINRGDSTLTLPVN